MTRDQEVEGFWTALAVALLHPTQLQIIEAARWIDRPLSASELVKVLGKKQNTGTVAYHARRLAELGALRRAGERQVRGAEEKFYRLAANPKNNGPRKRRAGRH